MSKRRQSWLHHWAFYVLAVLSSLLMSPAHATLPEIRTPGLVVQDVLEQPGIELGQFELPIQLVHLDGKSEGRVSFATVVASHGDLAGLSIPVKEFALSKPEEGLTVKPSFAKDGMYRVRADLAGNGFQATAYFWLLLNDGLVYYSSDTGSIVNSIAAWNLKNNVALQNLNRKADAAARNALEKSASPNAPRPSISELLSAEDWAEYRKIWQQQVDLINATMIRRSPAATKAGPVSKLASGEKVTVKFLWPTNASHTKFLPLEGAQIRVANLGNVADPTDNAQVESAVFASGVLNDKGEFQFTAPVNDLRYRVMLVGQTANFKVQIEYGTVANPNKKLLELRFDQPGTVFMAPGQPGFIYGSEVAQAWSVFQSIYELSEHSASRGGLGRVIQVAAVNTNMPMEGANFDPNYNTLNISAPQSFVWDALAHEYAHAAAFAMNSIQHWGGKHQYTNQYDVHSKPDPAVNTFQNKQRSNRLALGEGFASWFAVNFWKSSKYVLGVEGLGDTIMHIGDGAGGMGGYDLESSARPPRYADVYGEDSELAVMRFMWDMTDRGEEANARATCSQYCKENASVSFTEIMRSVINGRQLDGFSDFYQRMYRVYVGSDVGSLDNVGLVAASRVRQAIQMGAISAEFGLGANINTTQNPDPFRDIDAPTKRDLDSDPVVLRWEQMKTGSMPGLDQFEVLFYNESLDKLLLNVNVGTLAASGTSYQYAMTRAQVQSLINVLRKSGLKPEYKIVAMVKGVASGSGAGGPVSTGPYYGNAEVFTVQLGETKKYATIAVDSSGSNVDTDPSNLRIEAAHSMLKKMAARNEAVIAGTTFDRVVSVAALDFDAGVSVLSDFYDPQLLAQGEVFKGINSEGGTDIANAIRRSLGMLVGIHPTAQPEPYDLNSSRIYILTDMDNNDGLNAVLKAINEATAKNIPVNVGHLQPVSTTKRASSSGHLHGEPVGSLLKVAEPFDAMTAALLKGGGSYATIENAGAQQAWANLMDELGQVAPFSITRVNLPLDVKYYGFAQSPGNAQPTFHFTATKSGRVTITFDGKGSFVPNLKVAGKGGQAEQGQDLYALPFDVVAGQSYQININEPGGAAGLYSIVLRQTDGPVVTLPSMTLASIGSVTEGTAPVVSGKTTGVADGAAVTISFETTTKVGATKSLAKAATVVNATVSNNAFSATGPTNLPVGTTTMTVSIPGSGIAPQSQAFTVQAKGTPPAGAATPVPVDNPVALLVLAMVIAGFAGRKHLKSRR